MAASGSAGDSSTAARRNHVHPGVGGAGTVGLVADRLGRSSTLLELNPEYIELAKQRIYSDAPLFCEVETK